MTETENIEQDVNRRKRNSMARVIGIVAVVSSLVSAIVVIGIVALTRGHVINDLGTAVDDQRSQFVDCKTKPKSDPACQEPVAPEATKIINDVPGPKGDVGPSGPAGPVGPGATQSQVDQAVADFFDAFPMSTRIQQQVADYLRDNPPPAGHTPSTAEIARVVEKELKQNPPPPGEDGTDGKDGKDGISYTNVRTDGCNLVFTRSDGGTTRVGPVCGADGQDGTNGQDGQDGQDGAPGRGITSVTCNGVGLNSLTITYSDGTQDVVNCN